MIYLIIPFFNTSYGKRRDLREIMYNGEQMRLLRVWGDMNMNNRIKTIFGFFFMTILILFSFYITFSFCAVYTDSQSTFVLGWFITIFIDGVLHEIITEIYIALLYSCSRNSFFRLLFLNKDAYIDFLIR